MSYDPRNPAHRAAYEAGARAAQSQVGTDVRAALQDIAAQKAHIDRHLNNVSGGMRAQMRQYFEQQNKTLGDLATVADALRMQISAGGEEVSPVVRIENIPGRRVPFTMLVDIPIGPDTTSIREQSLTISQEGPFVATRRMAIFQSALEFQVTNDVTGATARLTGRSYGRYRPIHSACDFNDSQNQSPSAGTAWFLAATAGPPAAGTVLPTGALTLPSNMSSFRTMEFDGRVSVVNAGSSFPRQQIPVPTSMWTQYLNSPFDLSALDFFERGEVITFSVQPTHVNNPPAGNVDGECIFPAAAVANNAFGYPFVAGQYDAHEGICTPNGVVMGAAALDYDPALTDPVTRLPSGILTIGYEGYRIIQGPGPAAY